MRLGTVWGTSVLFFALSFVVPVWMYFPALVASYLAVRRLVSLFEED